MKGAGVWREERWGVQLKYHKKLATVNRRKDGQLKIDLERRIKQKWIRQVCAGDGAVCMHVCLYVLTEI